MNIKEAKSIVNKCMLVILSCNTKEQFNVAVKYADLSYKLLAKEIGLINNTQFINLIERSIGYAQCKVNYKIRELK